jgi:hypothetical protein
VGQGAQAETGQAQRDQGDSPTQQGELEMGDMGTRARTPIHWPLVSATTASSAVPAAAATIRAQTAG